MKKNIVKLRQLEIGTGIPKICVPVMGKTIDEVIEQTKQAEKSVADMIEWRVDFFEDCLKESELETVLQQIRNILGEKPLLFTFRTSKEGGQQEISVEDYCRINLFAANSGYVDLIDVELFMGEHIVSDIKEKIQESDVKIIASNHDFEKTPKMDELMRRLELMQNQGADIAKIAVMPNDESDVLELLNATWNMKYSETPIVTMSMGAMGNVSRLSGELFGSVITFGALEQASAPGQIRCDLLKQILETIHIS